MNPVDSSAHLVRRFSTMLACSWVGAIFAYLLVLVLSGNGSFAALLAGGGFIPVLAALPYGLLEAWTKIRPTLDEPRESTLSRVRNAKRLATALAVACALAAAGLRPEAWTAWTILVVWGAGGLASLGFTFWRIELSLRAESP
jgi:hypothetical protein